MPAGMPYHVAFTSVLDALVPEWRSELVLEMDQGVESEEGIRFLYEGVCLPLLTGWLTWRMVMSALTRYLDVDDPSAVSLPSTDQVVLLGLGATRDRAWDDKLFALVSSLRRGQPLPPERIADLLRAASQSVVNVDLSRALSFAGGRLRRRVASGGDSDDVAVIQLLLLRVSAPALLDVACMLGGLLRDGAVASVSDRAVLSLTVGRS